MNHFKVVSEYEPTGDQPQAIQKLSEGVLRGDRAQVLLGVTGSGKTNIYLSEADRALSAQKSVILLVPEIALTGQFFAHNPQPLQISGLI